MPGVARFSQTTIRRVLAILSIVAVSAVPCGVARAAMLSRGTNATAKICTVATDCPSIGAVARPTVTAHEIAVFLNQLWQANFRGGPQGPYQLQRCESPGPAPFHVECVLFSTGTPQDLAALRGVFEMSRLFTNVN
ncbi:MAG: hypothetical protein WA614_02770 [Acidimicrobiales bacterium]